MNHSPDPIAERDVASAIYALQGALIESYGRAADPDALIRSAHYALLISGDADVFRAATVPLAPILAERSAVWLVDVTFLIGELLTQ